MTNLLTTVLMKTDMRDSTPVIRALGGSDLSNLLQEHRQFVLNVAARYGGSLLKGEGDAFYLSFASVTAAALAAASMQEELRLTQMDKGDSRLAIRIVIVLGDILRHPEGVFGEAVNLAGRIESITPPDEIYLSPSAWLALNKGEVQTSFVGDYVFKGFVEPVKVYKIDRQQRTRTITDQAIVFTDLRGYTAFSLSQPIADVERLLDYFQTLHVQVCKDHGGTIRSIMGDTYFLTFPQSHLAIAAAAQLRDRWETLNQELRFDCTIGIGVHKGNMHVFRSTLFGNDINLAALLVRFTNERFDLRNCVCVTGRVARELTGSEWEVRLQRLELPNRPTRFQNLEVYLLV